VEWIHLAQNRGEEQVLPYNSKLQVSIKERISYQFLLESLSTKIFTALKGIHSAVYSL